MTVRRVCRRLCPCDFDMPGSTRMASEGAWVAETPGPSSPTTYIRSTFYFSWLPSRRSSRLSTWLSPAHSQRWPYTSRLPCPLLSTCGFLSQVAAIDLTRPSRSAVCAYHAHVGCIRKRIFRSKLLPLEPLHYHLPYPISVSGRGYLLQPYHFKSSWTFQNITTAPTSSRSLDC